MTATLLDGRQLAKKLRNELSAEVAAFTEEYGVVPTIAVVRAGEDPASVSYGGAIEKAFAKQGMGFALHTLPETARNHCRKASMKRRSRAGSGPTKT
jgi:methylenetetrahydrofolate dehydrogenase (NADP+)/methenyltetrahydrofolate cyclohydrolase